MIHCIIYYSVFINIPNNTQVCKLLTYCYFTLYLLICDWFLWFSADIWVIFSSNWELRICFCLGFSAVIDSCFCYLCCRDDDWSIEGKNNTLSFPSYYIDENVIIIHMLSFWGFRANYWSEVWTCLRLVNLWANLYRVTSSVRVSNKITFVCSNIAMPSNLQSWFQLLML